ncbi:PREDICTED: ATP synthase subunit e, mitochondrial, partial [Mesitornis unicolor]|uniref:ATP synthase subunit e, mitochondrial n=1 Tax=Mesitornis unicolor TaxID=54374 RepID=UPI0005285F7D
MQQGKIVTTNSQTIDSRNTPDPKESGHCTCGLSSMKSMKITDQIESRRSNSFGTPDGTLTLKPDFDRHLLPPEELRARLQRALEDFSRDSSLQFPGGWSSRIQGFKEKGTDHTTNGDLFGFAITQGQRSLGPERKEAICQIPEPESKRELRAFLGMARWCRLWIINFGLTAKPLYEAFTRYSALLMGMIYGKKRYDYLKPVAEEERRIEAEEKKKREELERIAKELAE